MIEFSYLKTNTCLICLTLWKVQRLTLLVHFYGNFTDRCGFCGLLLRCINKERLPEFPASFGINGSPRCQITKLVRGMSLILQTCQQVSSALQTEGPTALLPLSQPLARARFLHFARKSWKCQDLRRFPCTMGSAPVFLLTLRELYFRNHHWIWEVSRMSAGIHLFSMK